MNDYTDFDAEGKRICTKCGERRHTYWAYYFRGRCKKCIDKELSKYDIYGPNPFLALLPDKEKK